MYDKCYNSNLIWIAFLNSMWTWIEDSMVWTINWTIVIKNNIKKNSMWKVCHINISGRGRKASEMSE